MTEHKEVKQNLAVLVGLSCGILSREENADETSLEELAALLETAGGRCVGTVLQKKDSPDARTFIGEGKVAEVKELVQNAGAEMVIFDNPISPSQQRVLTEDLGVQVLDRAALILDIFAQRARTREGRLQVSWPSISTCCPACWVCGPTWSDRRVPSAPVVPARPSWSPTAATSAGRSARWKRSWPTYAESGPPSGCAGRRTRCPW